MAIRIVLTLLLAVTAFAMDPQRGKQVLREQNCLTCHNVRGDGGHTAPDLSERLIDHYTPSALAGLLWNHLPQMWTAISKDQVGRPRPTERDAEDVFAYLYSTHFTNLPGDQARGERAFEQRGCAACHTAGPGMPVANWSGIRDPFALVQQMWNHSALMKDQREKRGVLFEKLSSRDLADLTAYASKGAVRGVTPMILPATDQGEALFKANCGGCHPGLVRLEKRLQDRTPLEVAAGLWNHAASMQTVPLAAPNDMRAIVGHVWQLQFSQPQGDVARGAKAFTEKKCSVCHNQAPGAPAIARGERVFTSYSMISLWWAHGPLMQADLEKKRPHWPYLEGDDVANLVAYLNTRP
ncbi:MAG: c-type cytochrome [Acidobacteriota bacterium]